MWYNPKTDKMPSSKDNTPNDDKKQVRVRCYTCNVNNRDRRGMCKNLLNNTCPHGYRNT